MTGPSPAEVLLEQGRQIAAARQRQAELSQQMWNTVGNTIANAPAQYQAAQIAQQNEQLRNLQLSDLQQRQSDLKALDTAYSQPGGRDSILQNLPGHLRPTVQKQFDEADSNALALRKAKADADDAMSGYFSHLATGIATHNFDPSAAQLAISHAKDVFKDDPTMLSQIGQVEQQIQSNPTADTVRQIVTPLIQPQLMKLGKDESVVDIHHPSTPIATGPTPVSEPVAVTPTELPRYQAQLDALIPPTDAGHAQLRAATWARVQNARNTTEANKAIEDAQAELKSDSEPITVKTMENGKPVEKVMTRAQAMQAGSFASQPPASVQVNMNATNALANLPTWATDDSRPSGPTANKLDPTVRMTPNGLYQASLNYIANGQYPPTGRGNDPAAQAVRAAINAKVGAIAASSGMDEPALRAFYKANGASLTQQQKAMDSVQAFIATADKNAAPLQAIIDKIPDTGSPLLNQPLRNVDKRVFGSADMAEYQTYLKSVQAEYARIINQPNLAGQLTDSARSEAQQLLDPNATVAQQIRSLQALRNEGQNRLMSIGDQIQRIQQRLNGPHPPAGQSPTATPKVEHWDYDASGKLVKVSGPSGD